MANTMTALLPVLYKAAATVPREITGMLGSVDTTWDAKQVSKGDTVKVPLIAGSAIGDYTPAMTTTVGSNTTPATVDLSMDYSKEVSWHLTGEETQSLRNGGDNAMEFMRQKVEHGYRTLFNFFENLLCVAAKNGASRATGTAGTTPFATTIDAIADVQQILIDNGFSVSDGLLSLVLNSAASNKLKKLITINNQPAGSPAEELLRAGRFATLYGMSIKESAQFGLHTKGTATGIDVNNGAGYFIGDKTIVSNGSDSGTMLAGDCVTWAGDANIYVSPSNTITGAAVGNVVLNAPGLRKTLADTVEMTIGGNYTPNIAIHKSALKMVLRAPFIDATPLMSTRMVTDRVTGLSVMFCEIAGDGMTTYRMNLVGGLKVIQPEGIATLLG